MHVFVLLVLGPARLMSGINMKLRRTALTFLVSLSDFSFVFGSTHAVCCFYPAQSLDGHEEGLHHVDSSDPLSGRGNG